MTSFRGFTITESLMLEKTLKIMESNCDSRLWQKKEGKFEGNVLLSLNWAIPALLKETGMLWSNK